MSTTWRPQPRSGWARPTRCRVTIAAVAAPFGRDLDECFARIGAHIDAARQRGVDLLVLPEAALGGYLHTLPPGGADLAPDGGPPALDPDGPEIARLVTLAQDMVVCAGYTERDGPYRYNSAVCVHGDGVLGRHRKVHQPLGEGLVFEAGRSFTAFDSPLGRMGMMICYDKAFPEAGRSLALADAAIIACLSAWPISSTLPAQEVGDDRSLHRFNLYDQVRALENQVVWVASNQTGAFGSLRFVGNAKVVHPDGSVLATTGTAEGQAVTTIDVTEALRQARGGMNLLADRRAATYQPPCLLAGDPYDPRRARAVAR
ncbi:carbon-nitrogen hydrolase family protein [Parafrankia sp. EUN1f]|uniref:carbon-nitrogen hydrolase family protein n=1 Tax=Parafrankia sp. EUN1f TaxID=102897 RepID=UPI0001C46C5D|nr:carbon-nitrogen hydrolase family protein [Parafrankia sp. EUN1f]EFC80617.1 Nitrilase/cyanide hydratase and apolipoprotein N-acyltransferase [Parafrankia sp. EUN1f]